MRTILTILVASLALNASADKYFSVSGGGSGASWSSPATFSVANLAARGTTNWVMDGSYSGFTFDQAASGSTYAIIKKATVTSHGTSTGWSDTMGDGQASFGGIVIQTPYLLIDGLERHEAAGWESPTGYGIKIGEILADSVALGGNADGLRVYYSDIGPNYTTSYSSGWGYPIKLAYNQNDIVFSHCAIHNGVGALFQGAGCTDITFEYCNIGPGWGKEALRGGNGGIASNWTVRYCKFWNASQIDPDDGSSGITAEIALWDWTGTGSGNKFYGNWFFNQYSGGRNGVIVVGGDGGLNWAGGGASGTLVYNNTFAGLADTDGQLVILNGSGTEAKNNLVYSAGSGFSASSTANNVTSTSNPFVNYSTRDYRIISTTGGTYPRNAGTALASTYNQDPLGVTRGADGTWDVGAYEYDTGAPADTNAPSVAITSHTNNQQVTTTSISVSGTASDDTSLSSVTLTNTTTSTGFTVSGTTSWSATATVQLGTNYLRAIATDGAGNKATNTIYVVLVDTTAPSVTISSPTNNQHTASSTGTVTGTASDNIALSSVNVTNLTTGVRVVTTGSTSWSGTATYISGTNYLQAIATDTSGLKSTGTVYIVYTVPPPVINRATELRVTNWRQQ